MRAFTTTFGWLVLVLGLLPGLARSHQGGVLVLYEPGNEVHADFLQGLNESLADLGGMNTGRVRKVAFRDPGSLSDLLREPTVELVVTVGSRITGRVLDAAIATPLLSALVPSSGYADLIRQDASPRAGPSSAVFLDQPVRRQIALACTIKPGLSRIGVLLSASNGNRRTALEQAAGQYGVKLRIELVDDERKVSSAFNRLLDTSDVVIAVPDPLVVNPSNAKWLLYMAYQRRVPVVGFSEAFAKAGATTSVFSTPRQIGYQTAQQIAVWRRSSWAAIAAPAAPEQFEVATNVSVARSLGLRLPSHEALKAAITESDWGTR